jgi:catechol 2,3-dioxygenase-like lactoylglutathione lyase family enzyme
LQAPTAEGFMLGTHEATATIAVKDLEQARRFYEGTLGLSPGEDGQEDVLFYKTGRSNLLIYKSEFAGTNKATAATWTVGDVDAMVQELRGKGVQFERYDFPDGKREGDVHVFGALRAAWFKDPEGNIHHLVNHGTQDAERRT